MISLREIRNEKNKDKYRQKSLSLDVSPDLLNLHINKYAINCTKIVKEANNKKELDNIINQEWFQIRLDESFKGTKQMITAVKKRSVRSMSQIQPAPAHRESMQAPEY